jgi:hypothetical protein
MGVTRSFETGNSTAYLVAQPLVQLVEPGGYPLGTRRSALGRGRRIG